MSSETTSAVHAEELVAHEAKQPGTDGGNQQVQSKGVAIENGSNRGNNVGKIEALDAPLLNDDVTTESASDNGTLLAADNVQVDNFIIQSTTKPTTDGPRLDEAVEPSRNTSSIGKGGSASNDKKRSLPISGASDFTQSHVLKKYKSLPIEANAIKSAVGNVMGQTFETPYQANLSMQSSIPSNAEPVADAALAQQQFQQYQYQQMLMQKAMMTRQYINGPLEVVVPKGFKGGDRLTVEDPRDMRQYMITIPKNAVAGNILHVNVHMLDDGSKSIMSSAVPNPQHGMIGGQMPYLSLPNNNAYNRMQQSMYLEQQQRLNQQSNVLHKQLQVDHRMRVADSPIAAHKNTKPLSQETIPKPTPALIEGVPQLRDIPVSNFSAAQSKIDFEHEQRRLLVLEKILSHHGIDFKANRLGGALRGTCVDGIHCDLDAIICRVPTKSKKIEFKLGGALYDLMESKGGGSGFADLVSTVLAHDIAIMEAPSDKKKVRKLKCHLIPHKCGTKKQLLVDIKTYAIAKVKQDNGQMKVFSFMEAQGEGKPSNKLQGVPGNAIELNHSIDKSSTAALQTVTNMANSEQGDNLKAKGDGTAFPNLNAQDMLINNLSKSLELERARVNEYSQWIKNLTAENCRLKQELSIFYHARQANQAPLYTGVGQQPVYKM